jgi:hypothetical protein
MKQLRYAKALISLFVLPLPTKAWSHFTPSLHSTFFKRQFSTPSSSSRLSTTLFSSPGIGASRKQQEQPLPLFTQVISDVDDTLKSSGGVQVAGVALGGIDVQYERGELYPGVAEFMLALSSHPPGSIPAKIAILTARAEELKAALEIKEESKLAVALRQAGNAAGVGGWGIGPVLYGSVAEWIIQDRKGLRKFTNFERLIQQDPTGTIFQVCQLEKFELLVANCELYQKVSCLFFFLTVKCSISMLVMLGNLIRRLVKPCCENILKLSRLYFCTLYRMK